MKVYFSFPTSLYSRYRSAYEKIQSQIIVEGFEIAESLNATAVEEGDGLLDDGDWEILCKRHLASVKESDMVIVDVSDKSTFGIGYMTSVALQNNKPLLMLLREDSVGGAFISGLRHPLLKREVFTEDSVRGVVSGFLRSQGSVL